MRDNRANRIFPVDISDSKYMLYYKKVNKNNHKK